jgi:hypothetical protein
LYAWHADLSSFYLTLFNKAKPLTKTEPVKDQTFVQVQFTENSQTTKSEKSKEKRVYFLSLKSDGLGFVDSCLSMLEDVQA